MKKRICVFHFSPLELFPPAMNFLNCLAKAIRDDTKVIVYTTRDNKQKSIFNPVSDIIKIKRIARFTLGLSLPNRIIQYLQYHLISFFGAIGARAQNLVYFETISAFVPFLLFSWRKGTNLYIHYHEYMDAKEYESMWLNKTFHSLEKRIYPRAKWISHTNPRRIELFLSDLGNPPLSNMHVFPNYPPAEWMNVQTYLNHKLPLRAVHIGALGSVQELYIKEVFDWINKQSGKLTLDLYSFNISQEIQSLIEAQDPNLIRWKGPALYNDLPNLLPQYQIGIIMYRARSENTINSASNKLFEYLTCGLDVWYPQEIKGTYSYDSAEYWPKVIRLDFSSLQQYNLFELVSRKEGYQRKLHYSCEEASKPLLSKLL
jgi:hypothetical protein